MNPAAVSRARRLSWAAALTVGFALRVLPVQAARPYISYVDEGNLLHTVVAMLRTGRWDPGEYLYPQLPRVAVAAATRAYAPVYRARHGGDLVSALSGPPDVYDTLEPFAVLGLARAIGVALGWGTVVLAGLLAGRLSGPTAGAAAAWLAALAPALVLRAPIATVDSYATFFATLCLYLVARGVSKGPRFLWLLCGASAGAAFASKYPAVLVAVAPVGTILLSPIRWTERLRRIGLLAAGVVTGAVIAMPALVVRARDVIAAIRIQGAAYASFASGTALWRQALVRAEWDLSYEHPELGIVFVGAVIIGVLVLLRDHSTAPVAWGWTLWAALSLGLYGRQTFQPFRNLMPLVPAACAATAAGYARLRARVREPRWLDAAALTWVLATWGAPLAAYSWSRARLSDSRHQAVDWLAAHASAGSRTLVVRDLGILESERARIPGSSDVRWWNEARPGIRELRPDWIVAGVQRLAGGGADDAALQPWLSSEFAVRARYGSRPTVPFPGWWHGNDQVVYVLERLRPD